MLGTSSSVLLEAMVLINLLQGREFARMRRDDRVLEVALFLQSLHHVGRHGGVRGDGALRSEGLAGGETDAELMFMCSLNLAELLELFLILLLLLAISVDDVNCIIKVVLNLPHLFGHHLLHLLIVLYHALGRPVLDLAHNFVQDFGLELLFKVLVDCSQPWESFQVTAQQALIVTLQAFLKLCFGLFCSIFNLLERR